MYQAGKENEKNEKKAFPGACTSFPFYMRFGSNYCSMVNVQIFYS
jgi:hypothetical protein